LFTADLDARELRKQERRLRVQEQPFAVLAFLLEHAGTIVTRDELRAHVWPADTFVDFDHSLNTAVNKLRETLGDSATGPRFIETVARRGYRFIADVEWGESTSVRDSGLTGDRMNPDLELPPRRGVARLLFGLIQVMYLSFYLEALVHWQGVDRVSWSDSGSALILITVLVTAPAGIPVRFYLLSAVAFDYARFGEKFPKLFLGVFALDQLWAISPFLLLGQIGFGAAFAATAALLYVPFAERTLVRMAYGKGRSPC
jgi:cholera toxin transcriptional activator